MGDKSIPHIDSTEGSEQGKQRNSIRSVSTIRLVPPKPPRKTSSKEKTLSSHDTLEGGLAAGQGCFDRSNCKLTTETDSNMVGGSRRDSTMDNSSENDGLVEWVPPVHSIIFALEQQESAAYDMRRSVTPGSKCSIDFNKSDRFSHCRFNFDMERDGLSPPAVGRSQRLLTVKKTPPQVPVKTFKGDQNRISQTQFSSSPLQLSNRGILLPLVESPTRQLHDYTCLSNDSDISLSEVEKLKIYHKNFCPIRIDENDLERVPPIYGSEAFMETPEGLELNSLKSVGSRLCIGSGGISLDPHAGAASSSTGSHGKEQLDGEELEIRMKSITSFTTEDVEFCQRPEQRHPSQSDQPLTPCEETSGIRRMKDPTRESGSCVKERARNRRSRSVGAPGFYLKDFCQHKQKPKVPAKPRKRIEQDIVGNSPAERTVGDICGTFERVLVLQVNDDNSLIQVDKPVVSFEQSDVRINDETEVHTESGRHLKPGPLCKADHCRVENSSTENCSDSGGQKAQKSNYTEFFDEFGEQNVYKSDLIYVYSDSRLPNAPQLQFTQVSGDFNVEIAPELPLDGTTITSAVPAAAEFSSIEVSVDLNTQNILEPRIQEVASYSKLQDAPRACQRDSLYDEDGSSTRDYGSTRSFEVTSQSESLASNLVDLDQEMSLESSESLASSSAVKLNETDSSSESRIFRHSLGGSCDNIDQEKPFDDPQQRNMVSCDKASPSHSTDRQISKTASFAEFDVTFSTEDSGFGALVEGCHSSLFVEILQTLAKNSPTQSSEANSSESPYSQGKAVLIASDVSNEKSYDAFFDARKLSAAIDGMKLEMDTMCALDQQKPDFKQLNAECGPRKGSTTILRNMSGRLPEDRKKSMNRKASRAESFKAWQRITCRPTRKSSHKQRDSNVNVDDMSLSDNDDFDFEMDSYSDDSGPEFDISSPARRNETTERTKQLNARTAFHIASELLTTESNYVRKLHLVDQVFHLEVVVQNRQLHMFGGEVIPQMFSNIKSIYQFHHDFVLPQLEKRMMEWDANPRIGDVMKKFAPFLKLYTEYVRNFDNAITTINFWMERSPKFQKLIEDIQKLPECGQLNLQHHMLEPIQRVPRYQLLLKDYLRHLPEDSDDKDDTVEALELVTQAARHSNEVMRKIEKFRRLVDINESLGGAIDLISPSREFVKEGKLTRISARDGSRMDRYLFLFSDLFLVCQSLPLNIGQKQQYRMKSRMDFDGMEIVTEGHNLGTANTFYVKGKQKSIELHASSADEKAEWMTAFKSVIAEIQTSNQRDTFTNEQLGKRAPTWIKDQETSMCMVCSSPFSAFRRRHHCRACGKVVCGRCSSRHVPLAFIENREKRVCDACFRTLYGTQQRKGSTESVETVSSSDEPVRKKTPGILQVKASDPAVIHGYLNMCCKRKTWSRRFFAARSDYVLYSFKAHQDVVALESLPLPGYRVECDATDERLFKVFHMGQKKIFYFQAEDENTRARLRP